MARGNIRSDLSVQEREDYINAVLCLQSKPSQIPKGQVPGALSRFDDFVATHITQAPMLHDPVSSAVATAVQDLEPGLTLGMGYSLATFVCQPPVLHMDVREGAT